VLLKNLVGLLQPDEGEIWIDGEETSRFSEEEYFRIRRKAGMVFQQPALFDSLSIYDNIAFGLRRLEKLSEEQIRPESVRRSQPFIFLELKTSFLRSFRTGCKNEPLWLERWLCVLEFYFR
jgi:ABC-type Fe3+/spermidine/putrescine transport system ATPase subunit